VSNICDHQTKWDGVRLQKYIYLMRITKCDPMTKNVRGRRGTENKENTMHGERLMKPQKKGRQEIKGCVITAHGRRLRR
ncbi:hypothetical protein ACJX0J_042361, partial [Zea mays]